MDWREFSEFENRKKQFFGGIDCSFQQILTAMSNLKALAFSGCVTLCYRLIYPSKLTFPFCQYSLNIFCT